MLPHVGGEVGYHVSEGVERTKGKLYQKTTCKYKKDMEHSKRFY